MYGHSFLFVKPLNFNNVMSIIAVMTANIEFYTYSGNNGAATTVEFNREIVGRLNKQLYQRDLAIDKNNRFVPSLDEAGDESDSDE